MQGAHGRAAVTALSRRGAAAFDALRLPAMGLFSWRDALFVEPRPTHALPGSFRGPQNDGLAPAPTAPFTEDDDGARPPLPGLGEQDPLVLQAGITRLRAHDAQFDPERFAQLAAQAVATVERAWSTLDPQPSRAVLSPALWTAHRARMQLYALHGRRNVVDKLQVQGAKLVAVEQDSGRDRVTVRVRASSTDYDVDNSGAVVRGDTMVRTWAEDWTFERAADTAGRPEGGGLAGHCASCGAVLSLDAEGLCSYCHAAPADVSREWVVVSVADVRRQEDILRAVLGLRSHVRIDADDISPEWEIEATPLALQVDSARGDGASAPAPTVLHFSDAEVAADAVCSAARTAFVALRHAWMAMDVTPARPVMTESALSALAAQMSTLHDAGLHRVADDPLVESSVVVSNDEDAQWDRVTARVVATAVDADADSGGALVRGDATPHRFACDLVLVRRRAGEPTACPRCGAPLRASVSGVCDYCRAAVAGGGSEWVLDSVPDLQPAPPPPAESAAADGGAAAGPAAADVRPSPGEVLRRRDPGFNEAELLARARECFYVVEKAVAAGRSDGLQDVATVHFHDALSAQLADLHSRGEHRVLAFIDINDARLETAACSQDGSDRATVAVEVSGEDCVVADRAGTVVGGSDAQRRWTERWTLVRSAAGAAWLVEDVQA
jgi:predicted lipid-binding transport protein (Tim44 family)